jgi:hypothetical protein
VPSRISSRSLADTARDEPGKLFQRIEVRGVPAAYMLDAPPKDPAGRIGVESELHDETAIRARLVIEGSGTVHGFTRHGGVV